MDTVEELNGTYFMQVVEKTLTIKMLIKSANAGGWLYD